MLNHKRFDLTSAKLREERLKRTVNSLNIVPRKIVEDGKVIGKTFSLTFKCPEGEPDRHFGKTTEKVDIEFKVVKNGVYGKGIVVINMELDESTFVIKDPSILNDYAFYSQPPFERIRHWKNDEGLTLEECLSGIYRYRIGLLTISERERNGGKTNEEMRREEKEKFQRELKRAFYVTRKF
jgi:hypothetical protein